LRKLRETKIRKRIHLCHKNNIPINNFEVEQPKGFTNLSAAVFTEKEMAILNKGPSYVPPFDRKQTTSTLINEKSEIQSCYDRLLWKSPQIANSSGLTEFLSGCLRLNQHHRQRGYSKLEHEINRTIANIRSKCNDTTIVPSDKTKRLIALDQSTYERTLADCLNPEDTVVRNVHPKTIQSAYNKIIDKIACQYPIDSLIRKEIMSCKTSEPLPSNPYTLPKDHKDGPLKGRPIISTVNSVTRKLAQFLTKVLSPLIKQHVHAHIESSLQFRDFVESLVCSSNHSFFSLDVTNLYGSIPIADSDSAKGLLSVVGDFYSTHCLDSFYSDLLPHHFNELVAICLREDRYVFHDKCLKQIKGIAMGNPAAPPFAIIYMDYVEKTIIARNSTIIVWKRYIDDCFVVSSVSPQDTLRSCNQVNAAIKFTLEEPTNDVLPFLDLKVQLNVSSFTTSLHVKPLHSGTYLPFDSFCPLDRKRSLVKSELLRSKRNSSEFNQIASKNIIRKRLQNNLYTEKFIDSVVSRQNNNDHNATQTEYKSFLRLPYLGEGHVKSVRRLLYQSGLNSDIRVIFETAKPLSKQFRPPREEQHCKDGCLSCKCAVVPNNCLRKNLVYRIQCLICRKIYIGETYRTINSRVKEHLGEDKKSKVFLHLQKCCSVSHANIQWKVLGHFKERDKRLSAEALYQKNEASNLMEGCESKNILPFLHS